MNAQERTNHSRVVVVGGGYAGVSAARALARERGVQVTLVNASDEFVERVRLHQIAVGVHVRRASLAARLHPLGVRVVVGLVQGIDRTNRLVQIAGKQSGQGDLAYDYLVYAPGSRIDTSRVDGAGEHAVALTSPAASERIASRLAGLRAGESVIVIGGGLTGIEIAAEIAERHPRLQVRMLARDGVAPLFSRTARAYIARALRMLRIELVDGASALEIGADHVRFELADVIQRVPSALTLFCGGFVASPLAADAGLRTAPNGQLLVDASLRALDDERIVGAGDAVSPTSTAGAPIYTGCKYAMPTGVHAARSICEMRNGHAPRPLRWVDTLFCVSIGQRDGVVDLRRSDGAPRERILSGMLGAITKELLMRYAFSRTVPRDARAL